MLILELIIFAATVILLIIILRKLPLEKEIVKKISREADQLENGGSDKEVIHEDALDRADHLAKAGQYSKAERVYLRLITKDPKNAGLYNKLALTYLGKKDFKDAAKALSQALELDSKNDAFHNNLGLLFYQQGKYDEAIDGYERSIEINNKVASRFMNLGLAYFMLKKYRKAADAYEKALILEPDNEEYKKLLSEVEEKLA